MVQLVREVPNYQMQALARGIEQFGAGIQENKRYKAALAKAAEQQAVPA